MMEKPFTESWFYAPGMEAVGDTFMLPGDEAHHLRKVLRVPAGTRVTASNGAGLVFLCDTAEATDTLRLTALEILHRSPAPPPVNMALSLLKGRDLEEPVEGLAQLEIHRIFIVTTDHTQEIKGQDHGKLLDRLRAKSLVGLKQAKKAWLTEVHAPVTLRDWRESWPDLKLVVAAPGADRGLPEEGRPYALAVGPEGGFSEREAEWFAVNGAGTLSLGNTRIRGTHAPLLAAGKLMGLRLA